MSSKKSSKPRHPQTYEFCLEHFNEPVIDSMRVVRLIGYAETAVDCYYVVHCMERGVYWASAVGPCMHLRTLKEQDGVIARDGIHDGDLWNNFTRLDSWLGLNGAPRAGAFICDIRPDDNEGMNPFGPDVGKEVIE